MSFTVKNMRNWILAIIMVVSVGGVMLTVALPQTASAACDDGILGFPPWYKGLNDKSAECNLLSPSDPAVGGLDKYIWTIALNIVDIILVAIAYASGGYLLFGGFLFITSRGNPDGAANARKTMTNATIGLLISIAAVAIVNFVVTGVR